MTVRTMIDHVTIRNFRSLADVTVPLGPLTVLVGPNASGKSNIINALQMVRGLASDDIREPYFLGRYFDENGAYEQVVWGGESAREISVEVAWATLEHYGNSGYSVSVGKPADTPVVIAERAYLAGEDWLVRKSSGMYIHGGVAEGSVPDMRSVAIVVQHDWDVTPVFDSVRRWAFYQLSPRTMKQPKPVQKEYRLSEDGSNLSTVIHTLFSEGAPAFRQIEEFIRSVLPNVERLLSPIAGSNLTNVALKEHGVPTPIGSWGLSDGTLFALALATALYTPLRPSLLALEAPDTELHPYVLEAIAELLVEASRETQVLVTTHSPYLLDHLPVESLVVVEKKQGATTCRQVKTRGQARKAIQQLGVGKAWYAGHLGGVP